MTAPNDPWTIARVLSWAGDDFRARGFDSPRLDAELLLCRVLGCDRVRLLLDGQRPLGAEELSRVKELIQRRRKAEPMAYILGEREFYGLPIRVDRRVLVPRPDTEILVETALTRTERVSQFGVALDLCTGSGCVAIAFARARPTWTVWATDLSSDALDVARTNAQRLGAPSIVFRAGDLFDALEPTQRFTLITANPPYIPNPEIPGLQADIREFEPHLALDGGGDGLEIVRRLISKAGAHLQAGGVLALEIGYDQAPRVESLLQRAGFTDVERTRDYGGHERVVSGRAPVRPA
ncbi:MAG TPA: peptide chain release factor N(5)-glutamine methyltransferase [Polyangiaceae bacterium]|jgi:release factor glutamine methyltransferase|nr:peptide chain release factor N(5)-glutamine methyltransferase [Polyangiaceae bacterium]